MFVLRFREFEVPWFVCCYYYLFVCFATSCRVNIIPFPVRLSVWAPYPTHKLYRLNRDLTYVNTYGSAVTFQHLLTICLYYFRSWFLVSRWLCPCSSVEPMARFPCPRLLRPSGSRRFGRPKCRLGLYQINLSLWFSLWFSDACLKSHYRSSSWYCPALGHRSAHTTVLSPRTCLSSRTCLSLSFWFVMIS